MSSCWRAHACPKKLTQHTLSCLLQSTTRVKPFICTMPMRLDEGWNQIQFNLADFTRRAYGEQFGWTLCVQCMQWPAVRVPAFCICMSGTAGTRPCHASIVSYCILTAAG